MICCLRYLIMTAAVEAIELVNKTWILTQEALSIVRREIHSQNKNTTTASRILTSTIFEDHTLSQTEIDITECKQAAEDYAILSMWAIFERHLIIRLECECQKMLQIQPTDFNQRVFEKMTSTIEYWRIDEAIDLIKPLVGSDLAGQAKSIKKYRDWVAHRNPRKPTPAKIDPQTAREILKIIAAAIDNQ
jgi:hypothetical protein